MLSRIRKTTIIRGKNKYIYNKFIKTEELYDIEFDLNENINLLQTLLYDQDLNNDVNAEQVIFYPWMIETMENYKMIKEYSASFWKTDDRWTESKNYIVRKLKNYKVAVKRNLNFK